MSHAWLFFDALVCTERNVCNDMSIRPCDPVSVPLHAIPFPYERKALAFECTQQLLQRLL